MVHAVFIQTDLNILHAAEVCVRIESVSRSAKQIKCNIIAMEIVIGTRWLCINMHVNIVLKVSYISTNLAFPTGLLHVFLSLIILHVQ